MAIQDDKDLYYAIEIDWCRCPLLESVPGKVSGAWVIKGAGRAAGGGAEDARGRDAVAQALADVYL